jgi:hypothetical protein
MEHAGGFIDGMFLATLFLFLEVADCDDTDQSLLRIIRPSLYRAGLYDNSNFSPQSVLINRSQSIITGGISFKMDGLKPDRQVQHSKKLV